MSLFDPRDAPYLLRQSLRSEVILKHPRQTGGRYRFAALHTVTIRHNPADMVDVESLSFALNAQVRILVQAWLLFDARS